MNSSALVPLQQHSTLVLRVLWWWLRDHSRFYCVSWQNMRGNSVVVTFGVSSVLLTLTHEMRWWAGVRLRDEAVLCANNYLVKSKVYLLFLQDRVSGQRFSLFDLCTVSEWVYCVNCKWLVVCDRESKVMLIVKIPKKNPATGTTTIQAPTTVAVPPLGSLTFDCLRQSQFPGYNEDHLLLIYDFFIQSIDSVELDHSKIR
ncbi:hypothetical protein Pelo_19496 [Pelomyxa schiedti]|nr:hypothetical protein Pelo_19496 [Pelomyxa schiedti]